MKKLAILIMFMYCPIMLHSASFAGSPDEKETVEINEKFFIQQCMNVYLNPEDFQDKLLKIEGLCEVWDDNGETHYLVYRNTPGCCGNDGTIGFMFLYKGEEKLASKNWISVTASVNIGKNPFGQKSITLDATEVIIKEKHGAEFVMN